MMKKHALWMTTAVVILVVCAAGAQDSDEPFTNNVEMRPGAELMIHGSADIPVELFIDAPENSSENILFVDVDSGKSYALPNRSTVRLQGDVVLRRDKDAQEIGRPMIRWRYVSSMFSFSRSPSGR